MFTNIPVMRFAKAFVSVLPPIASPFRSTNIARGPGFPMIRDLGELRSQGADVDDLAMIMTDFQDFVIMLEEKKIIPTAADGKLEFVPKGGDVDGADLRSFFLILNGLPGETGESPEVGELVALSKLLCRSFFFVITANGYGG